MYLHTFLPSFHDFWQIFFNFMKTVCNFLTVPYNMMSIILGYSVILSVSTQLIKIYEHHMFFFLFSKNVTQGMMLILY